MTATIAPYRPPQQDGGDGFAPLLHAEWTKFRTLRGWVIAIVIAVAVQAREFPRPGRGRSSARDAMTPRSARESERSQTRSWGH